MPRPGPRPYVCERRAWHSDRHQPMRGSLIQEIFRLVSEIHNPTTRKNKEWQEKLPVVVLKAEEIMYSKANSEAEYMDIKTLWDRTNDAINTIIRRDESTETERSLQPCIEAALNLGCTPRRTLRSQRYSNQTCYLNSSNEEAENFVQGDYTTNKQYITNYSDFVRSTTMNATHSGSESQRPVVQNTNPIHRFPFAPENVKQRPVSSINSGHPLYYGAPLQIEEPRRGFGILPQSLSSKVRAVEPGEVGAARTLLSCDGDNTNNKITRIHVRDIIPENPHEHACDLSLRLGPLSAPCSSPAISDFQGAADDLASSSQERSKAPSLTPSIGTTRDSFLPRISGDDRLNSSSVRWNAQREDNNADARLRKRKADFSSI